MYVNHFAPVGRRAMALTTVLRLEFRLGGAEVGLFRKNFFRRYRRRQDRRILAEFNYNIK